MSDIIDRLKEPDAHYPGNFDTPKRANAMLSCLCQEAMEEIESLRQQLAEKDAEIERLNSKLRNLALDCLSADGQALDSLIQLAALQAVNQQLREFSPGQWWHKELLDIVQSEGVVQVSLDTKRAVIGVIDNLLKKIHSPADTSALEALIAKAVEMMRERTHSAMLDLKPWDHRGEIIRAIPAVTLDDLKD